MENNNGDQRNVAVQASAASKIVLKHSGQEHLTNVSQSYAPFLNKSKRYQNNDSSSPPPGQYQNKSCFDKVDSRDLLQKNYNLIMENSKKIKQSVIFKSTAKRFNYKETTDFVPISYSHNSQTKIKQASGRQKYNHKRLLTKINQFAYKFYPSIPDRSLKYGYVLQEKGNLDKLGKTGEQITKERQAMKKYVKNLNGQKNYITYSSNITAHDQSSFIALQNLKKKTNNTLQKSNVSKSSCNSKQNKIHFSKKPITVNNFNCNKKKIHKIIQDKKQLKKELGPGSYQIAQIHLGSLFKPQKFQFFNSTAERFKSDNQIIVHKSLKKLQLQRKMECKKRQTQIEFWKGLKKLKQKDIRKSEMNLTTFQPGPGDYDPNQKLVKAKLGKSSIFRKSPRFDEQKQSKQLLKSNTYTTNSYCKQMKANQLHERNQNYSYNQLSGNNNNIKLNKSKMQQKYSYKTKGMMSDYSIREWQNRPLSRNQALFALKDLNRAEPES